MHALKAIESLSDSMKEAFKFFKALSELKGTE
jgi:hypothetical protein